MKISAPAEAKGWTALSQLACLREKQNLIPGITSCAHSKGVTLHPHKVAQIVEVPQWFLTPGTIDTKSGLLLVVHVHARISVRECRCISWFNAVSDPVQSKAHPLWKHSHSQKSLRLLESPLQQQIEWCTQPIQAGARQPCWGPSHVFPLSAPSGAWSITWRAWSPGEVLALHTCGCWECIFLIQQHPKSSYTQPL